MVLENLKIRALDPGDLDAIVEIDKKVLGQNRPEYWKRKIQLSDIYPTPSLVAEVDNKVVGFVLSNVSGWEFGIPDSVGWIDTIGVDPEYQNRGVGRALMEALIKNLKTTGRETTPEEEQSDITGVKTVYTLVKWNDWELLQFFHAMGFKRGEIINLELKISE
ncbi:MAG: GNAT family N-acetyltransferase [Deltaproteobacteria bacterium]|nr:GNAT family N-acetyltransferase [Deltaproteobacteria bacterium]